MKIFVFQSIASDLAMNESGLLDKILDKDAMSVLL